MIRMQSPGFLQFGVVTDIHFPTDPTARRPVVDSLRRCVQRCNAEQVDFVVQLGDLIEAEFQTYDAALAALSGLQSDLFHVLGNHDFDVDDRVVAGIADRLSMPSPYYAFSRCGYRFVVLDGNEVSLHAHPRGSPDRAIAEHMLALLSQQGAMQAEPWNGAISRKQAAWLEEELAQAGVADEPVVVLNHFPVWPPSRNSLWNDEDVLEILMRHNHVVLYANGHAHERSDATHRGIRFVTAPALVLPEHLTPLTLVQLDGVDIDVQFLSLQGEG